MHVPYVAYQTGEIRKRLQVLLVMSQTVAPLTMQFRFRIALEVVLNVSLALLVLDAVFDTVLNLFELKIAAVPQTFVNLKRDINV